MEEWYEYIYIYSSIGIIFIPFMFYIIQTVRLLIRNYLDIAFFYNFFSFFFFSIFMHLFYTFFFSVFFFYNLWRYLKFFKKLGHHVYFTKISIYASLWQYILVNIYISIYYFIMLIFMYIYKGIKNIYFLFFLKIVINNRIFYYLLNKTLNFFLSLYNNFLILKKMIFNLSNIEYMEPLYYMFFFWKKDLNNKYIDDPILHRNSFFKVKTNVDDYFNMVLQSNIYIKNKNILFLVKNNIFLFFIYILDKYIRNIFNIERNIKFLLFFLKNIYNNVFFVFIKILIKQVKLISIYIYLLILNVIYTLIKLLIYLFFYVSKILYILLKKNIFLMKYLLLLLLIVYFNWIIYYFFLILYNHYILYIPLFDVKESFRFLDFEWIDLRNYFNLVKVHNTLLDINIYNNFIYNGVIKQLNFKLNNYNLKFTSNFNINLYSMKEFNNIVNNDTILLNSVFEKWNKYNGSNFIRRWRKYKRMLNWSLRNTFKGKHWYDAIKQEKLKTSNLSIFNAGRYFEVLKTEMSANIGFWDNLHQLKKLPYDKELKAEFQKKQAWYTYFKKCHASKKRSRFFLSYYIRVKHIPFKHIYKEFDTFFMRKYKLKKAKEIYLCYDKYLKKLRYINSFNFLLKKVYVFFKVKRPYHGDQFYFLKKYSEDFALNKKKPVPVFKNRIPTLVTTEVTWYRGDTSSMPVKSYMPSEYLHDYISMGLIDEMPQLQYYKDIAKRSCLRNIFFKTYYTEKKYPYNINKKYHSQNTLRNYFNTIDTGVKISKKFYFFDINRVRNFNRLSHRFLVKLETVYGNHLLKYKYWDRAFYFNRLNKRNIDFWGFFDYLKAYKYKIANKNDEDNFTYFFLERWKKDYYHLRVYLLRIISFLYYHDKYKKLKLNIGIPSLQWVSQMKGDINPITYETLSTLNSLKFYREMQESLEGKEKEPEPMSEELFNHYKLRWHFKELLNPSSGGIYGNKKQFMYCINLFHKKFSQYFVECKKINKYNKYYQHKVKSYKIKVLRKIKNLKVFFYFNTKRNKGLRIFSYLNVFSIQYHLKHLIWHSTYSYLLFKKSYVYDIECVKPKEFFYFRYQYKDEYNKITEYKADYYIYIFNILLNIPDIKEEWAFYLTDENEEFLWRNRHWLDATFYYCYYYGNFYYIDFYELDVFILFIGLLKGYYNNFFSKLVRYRYILDEKEYTLMFFFKRYMKQWYKSFYIKIRYSIYQNHEVYMKSLKKKMLPFLCKKYWIKNRVGGIPFWFIFDYYTKSFIKIVFKNYYTRYNFTVWWLNYRLNYTFCLYFWVCIQKYKYFCLYYLKKLLFFKMIKNLINNVYIALLYLLNNSIIYIWYFKILINRFGFFVILDNNIETLKLLYKIVFFNYYFFMRENIAYIFYYMIDLKYWLYFKLSIKEFLKYFLKFLQNFKKDIIYNKSNDYYWKKQKLVRKRKRHVPLYSFLSTNLKRNWFSLRIRSSNFFISYNLYLLNMKHIFIFERNISLSNFIWALTNNIPFIRERLLNTGVIFVLLYILYIIYFIIIFIFKKKYFKIFFFKNREYNEDPNLILKEKRNKNIFNNLYKFDKKNLYIYKFFLSNLYKNLNFFNIFYKKKYSWFKNIFFYKKYLNYSTFDQFDKDIPIYKSFLFFQTFINVNKFNRCIKLYRKFFLIKRFPFKKIFNDFLAFSEFYIKKENIIFKYKGLTDFIYFDILFFYWFLLIPYFIFNYLLIKYHLKPFIKTRRRVLYYVKAYLDNIRLIVRVNKYIGRPFFKTMYRSKRWKDTTLVFLIRKKQKRTHFTMHNIRYRKLYYRISPLGSYYYWFSKIDIVKYVLSFKNYFFKSAVKSINYSWLIIIYWLIIFYSFKKFNKNKFLKKFIFIKFLK